MRQNILQKLKIFQELQLQYEQKPEHNVFTHQVVMMQQVISHAEYSFMEEEPDTDYFRNMTFDKQREEGEFVSFCSDVICRLTSRRTDPFWSL